MRHVLLPALLLFFMHSYCQPNAKTKNYLEEILKGQKPLNGKPFPPFTATDHDSVITNKTWLGKTVYINFWFESCAPCIAEMEALDKLYEKLKDSSDIQFVSITFESPQHLEELKAKHLIKYTCLSLSHQECRRLNFGLGYPTHFILNSKGIITHLSLGGPTKKEEAEERVMKELLPAILSTSAN